MFEASQITQSQETVFTFKINVCVLIKINLLSCESFVTATTFPEPNKTLFNSNIQTLLVQGIYSRFENALNSEYQILRWLSEGNKHCEGSCELLSLNLILMLTHMQSEALLNLMNFPRSGTNGKCIVHICILRGCTP